MYSHERKEKTIKSAIRYGVIAVIALALTFPSMEVIKKLPGNSFKSELEYIATTLLVSLTWFVLITLCAWLINYLVNSKKMKNNPSNRNARLAVTIETNRFKTIAKILTWAIIIACVYGVITFLVSFIVFSGAAHK